MKSVNIQEKKGFTLIELLIVIAIIAILGSATVLVLNPVELMKQGRDGTRINDMDNLERAIHTYAVSAASVNLDFRTYCVGTSTTGVGCASSGATTATITPFTNLSTNTFGAATNVVASTAIDGNGWVDVKFTDASGGSPIPALPLDPVNNTNYFYAYKSSASNTFKLAARLESLKYRDKMVNDGGTKNTCSGSYVDATCFYENGSDMSL